MGIPKREAYRLPLDKSQGILAERIFLCGAGFLRDAEVSSAANSSSERYPHRI